MDRDDDDVGHSGYASRPAVIDIEVGDHEPAAVEIDDHGMEAVFRMLMSACRSGPGADLPHRDGHVGGLHAHVVVRVLSVLAKQGLDRVRRGRLGAGPRLRPASRLACHRGLPVRRGPSAWGRRPWPECRGAHRSLSAEQDRSMMDMKNPRLVRWLLLTARRKQARAPLMVPTAFSNAADARLTRAA